MLKLTDDNGIYILELHSKSKFKIANNKFNEIIFPAGYYYYVGSAQKNLQSRLKRHAKKAKKLHWHIDYLTSHKNVILRNIYVLPGQLKKVECELTNKIITQKNFKIIVKGFGNSDCNSCESHLIYSKKKISYNHLCSLYQSTVLFIPSSSDIC